MRGNQHILFFIEVALVEELIILCSQEHLSVWHCLPDLSQFLSDVLEFVHYTLDITIHGAGCYWRLKINFHVFPVKKKVLSRLLFNAMSQRRKEFFSPQRHSVLTCLRLLLQTVYHPMNTIFDHALSEVNHQSKFQSCKAQIG